jgi:hypothetical protein
MIRNQHNNYLIINDQNNKYKYNNYNYSLNNNGNNNNYYNNFNNFSQLLTPPSNCLNFQNQVFIDNNQENNEEINQNHLINEKFRNFPKLIINKFNENSILSYSNSLQNHNHINKNNRKIVELLKEIKNNLSQTEIFSTERINYQKDFIENFSYLISKILKNISLTDKNINILSEKFTNYREIKKKLSIKLKTVLRIFDSRDFKINEKFDIKIKNKYIFDLFDNLNSINYKIIDFEKQFYNDNIINENFEIDKNDEKETIEKEYKIIEENISILENKYERILREFYIFEKKENLENFFIFASNKSLDFEEKSIKI